MFYDMGSRKRRYDYENNVRGSVLLAFPGWRGKYHQISGGRIGREKT